MLWLGPVLPLGDALAQNTPPHDAPSAIAQSIARNDSATPEIRIWRTITLGTRKGVDAYREALDAAGIKIGDSADEVLARRGVAGQRQLAAGMCERILEAGNQAAAKGLRLGFDRRDELADFLFLGIGQVAPRPA
jgi:hypothetical protein